MFWTLALVKRRPARPDTNIDETLWATDVIKSRRGLDAYCKCQAGGVDGGSGKANTDPADTGP